MLVWLCVADEQKCKGEYSTRTVTAKISGSGLRRVGKVKIKNTRDSREREKRIRTGHYKGGQQKKSDKTDAVLTAYSNNSHDNNGSTFV